MLSMLLQDLCSQAIADQLFRRHWLLISQLINMSWVPILFLLPVDRQRRSCFDQFTFSFSIPKLILPAHGEGADETPLQPCLITAYF